MQRLPPSYVVKVFLKPDKYMREIHAIPLTHDVNVLRIIDHGILENGHEWIIYNYIDGWILEHIYDDLDLDQLRSLFYQMGHKVAEIHQVMTFDYFGDWRVEKQSHLNHYRSHMIEDTERMIRNIYVSGLPDKALFDVCVKNIREEYDNIRPLSVGRLCHRDLDGRNIIVGFEHALDLKVKGIIDFEKTIIGNEYMDIIGFYKKYFIHEPKLIHYFFKGYEEVLKIDMSFNQELRFNLYRVGIDICSWSYDFSKPYYDETVAFLKQLVAQDAHLIDKYKKPQTVE